MNSKTFSILITTKNRVNDLAFTLSKVNHLFLGHNVVIVLFDDGSTDGTLDFVKNNYPKIVTYRNEVSKGYMFCRNKMLD